MEREATLLVLSLALCGPLLLVAAALTRPSFELARSGRSAELAAWRRLWLPLVPAALALMVFIGWALQEPDDTDEILDPLLLAVALPAAIIGARAIARALRSLWTRARPLAGTVGLLRPRIEIDESLETELAEDELAAVHAHERAHARHRDPFRIWLGQLIADLQWPTRTAARRYRLWLHALELARDEEAREAGIDGESLAAAVVRVARLAQQRCGIVARLAGNGEMLRDRIHRLLTPLVTAHRLQRLILAAGICVLLAIAVTIGLVAGNAVLVRLPGVTSV